MVQVKEADLIEVGAVVKPLKRQVKAESNGGKIMYKTIFYTVLVTVAICGTAYFYIGRTDYTELRDIADGIQRSNKEAQCSIGEITGRLDGLNDTSARITERSNNLTEGSQRADIGVTTIKAGLGEANDSIERIERRNIKVIRILGSLNDTNYEFRKLIKENTSEK